MAWKHYTAIVLLVLIGACGTPPQSGDRPNMHVSFLTRDGCSNTPVMRERLEAAFAAIGLEADLTVVDVGKLGTDDPLTGYGTPTVLVGGHDLFGAPAPGPAPPI